MKTERIVIRKKNKMGKDASLALIEGSLFIKTIAKERISPMKKMLRKETTLKVNGCHGSKSRCAISICLLIFASSFSEALSLKMLPKLLNSDFRHSVSVRASHHTEQPEEWKGSDL